MDESGFEDGRPIAENVIVLFVMRSLDRETNACQLLQDVSIAAAEIEDFGRRLLGRRLDRAKYGVLDGVFWHGILGRSGH